MAWGSCACTVALIWATLSHSPSPAAPPPPAVLAISFNPSLLLDRSAQQQMLKRTGGGRGRRVVWRIGSEFLRWRCSWSVVNPNYNYIQRETPMSSSSSCVVVVTKTIHTVAISKEAASVGRMACERTCLCFRFLFFFSPLCDPLEARARKVRRRRCDRATALLRDDGGIGGIFSRRDTIACRRGAHWPHALL